MNENTWQKILQWEQLNPTKVEAGKEPKLLKFLGKPHNLSPKAQIKVLLGHPAPFDRHDWIVDRGGKEVRYVIDYYNDESAVALDETPTHLKDISSMKSIVVDVRPALDSFSSLFDVFVWMPVMQGLGINKFSYPPFFPPSKMVIAEKRKNIEILQKWTEIQKKCETEKNKLTQCNSDEDCSKAAIALQRCSASVVCSSISKDFDDVFKTFISKTSDKENGKNVEQKMENIYNSMVKCLEIYQIDLKKAITIEQDKKN
jgi:cytochrome c heme-lyase